MSEGGAIAGLAVIYVLLFLFLVIRSIKRGHWIMFLLYIPTPDLSHRWWPDAAGRAAATHRVVFGDAPREPRASVHAWATDAELVQLTLRPEP